MSPSLDHLAGRVVKVSALRVADPALISVFFVEISPGQVIPVTSKLALQWLSCPNPGDRVSTGTGWPGVSIL